MYGVIYKVPQVSVFCFLRFPLPPEAVLQCLAALEQTSAGWQLAAAKTRQVYTLLPFKTLLSSLLITMKPQNSVENKTQAPLTQTSTRCNGFKAQPFSSECRKRVAASTSQKKAFSYRKPAVMAKPNRFSRARGFRDDDAREIRG